jgi:hypothetical protein
MTSQCLPVLQFDAVRVTRLNSCGTPQDSTCAYATSEGIITLAMTNNNQERQEYLQLNGQGNICVDETKEAQLRWIDFELTFCNVDPELFNIITAEPLVLNDAASPVAIGFDKTQGAALNSFFALEAWTNTGGGSCDDNQPDYGYFVMPFAVGGLVSDITLENANINFTVTGRTKKASLWGTGPFNVRLIEAAGPDLGEPAPLLTAIGSTVHRRQFWTELPPPPGVCGCQDLTPTVLVAPLSATAATLRTLTFPLNPATGQPALPGYIDWGDATPTVLVTAGINATHTYAVGSYTATYRTSSFSGPTWTSGTIIAT